MQLHASANPTLHIIIVTAIELFVTVPVTLYCIWRGYLSVGFYNPVLIIPDAIMISSPDNFQNNKYLLSDKLEHYSTSMCQMMYKSQV